jgi:hypothetical protein
VSIAELLKISASHNRMQFDDLVTAEQEFEKLIESVSIVLPNCEEWIKTHMPFVSTTQLFIKS